MDIQGVIFDMDGLMFDTENLWVKCCIKTGKDMGYDIAYEMAIQSIGSNYENVKEIFLNNFGEEFPFEEFYSNYRKLMDEQIVNGHIGIKKGLNELLNFLVENGYKFAIASSSSIKIIEFYLKCAGIDKGIFNALISGLDCKHGKPSPDIFLKTCDKIGINPNNVLVLEDSNRGILAAKRAGCKAALIPDIDIIKNETREIMDYEFSSLLDVISLLKKQL